MKQKQTRRVRGERNQSNTRRDGQLFANICKGIWYVGLLILEFFK